MWDAIEARAIRFASLFHVDKHFHSTDLTRARMAIFIAILFFIVCLVVDLIDSFLVDMMWSIDILVIAAPSAILSLLTLGVFHQLRLASAILVLGLSGACFIWANETGGLMGAAMGPLLAAPFFAAILFGRFSALVAGLFSASAVAYFTVRYIMAGGALASILETVIALSIFIIAITLVALVYESINERLRTRLILARDGAVASNDAKTVFLTNMTHELRTPLNGIKGLLELIRSTDCAEKRWMYLSMMESTSNVMGELIDDSLNVARISAQRQVLKDEPFNIRSVIGTIINAVTGLVEPKGVSLTIETDPGAPEWVAGDSIRLRQVLLNLLGNAAKVTDAGTITMRYSWADGIATFVISDTGPGIAANEIEIIFDRFRQTEYARKRSIEGSGLGLAITKEMVEAMDGRISVDSEYGQGATFTVELPFPKTEMPVDDSDLFSDEADPDAGSVLVAEDSPVSQMVIVEVLQHAGYSVVTANNGEDAVALAARSKFDLIIMDIHMPTLSGDMAIKRIRKSQDDYADIPILALTADKSTGTADRVMSVGAHAFLTKPVSRKELLETVQYLSWVGRAKPSIRRLARPHGEVRRDH
jgi:signal transduction histidine kinase/CheY-like chemotaxis protein